MDKHNTTTGSLDQADEEILTPTVSDEALEAGVTGPVPNPTGFCYVGYYPQSCA
jgi:hypothetical protein